MKELQRKEDPQLPKGWAVIQIVEDKVPGASPIWCVVDESYNKKSGYWLVSDVAISDALDYLKNDPHHKHIPIASAKEFMGKKAIVDMGRESLERIFNVQSKTFADPNAQTMVDDYVIKALHSGYNKDEIVQAIMKFYNQDRNAANGIFDRASKNMKLSKKLDGELHDIYRFESYLDGLKKKS